MRRHLKESHGKRDIRNQHKWIIIVRGKENMKTIHPASDEDQFGGQKFETLLSGG